VLIDQTGHARLADFGLLTIISDPANLLSSSSYTQGGTARWMSPELIAPERFGFKNSRPTKSSDCYALGMVIYETISGHLPFHEHTDFTVFVKVLEGKRPPRGASFTRSLWKMMEQCWTSQSNDRPSIEDVLGCLETSSHSSEPLSPEVDEGMETDGGSEDTSDRSPPTHSNGLPDQESKSRSRGSPVSSYPHSHYHSTQEPGLLKFDSTHRSTALLPADKPSSSSRKPSHSPSSVVSNISPESMFCSALILHPLLPFDLFTLTISTFLIVSAPPSRDTEAAPQNPKFNARNKPDTSTRPPTRDITSLDPSSSDNRTSVNANGPQSQGGILLPTERILLPTDLHRSGFSSPDTFLTAAGSWKAQSDRGRMSGQRRPPRFEDTNFNPPPGYSEFIARTDNLVAMQEQFLHPADVVNRFPCLFSGCGLWFARARDLDNHLKSHGGRTMQW